MGIGFLLSSMAYSRNIPSSDILIFSASPTGIAAAVYAARQGCSVRVIDKRKEIDVQSFVVQHGKTKIVRTGFYGELTDSVQQLIERKYFKGGQSPDLAVLRLFYEKSIQSIVKKLNIRWEFEMQPDSGKNLVINTQFKPIQVRFLKNGKKVQNFEASFFIDCSVSGSLMARFPCRYLQGAAERLNWDVQAKSGDQVFSSFGGIDWTDSEIIRRLEGMYWLTFRNSQSTANQFFDERASSSIGTGCGFSETEFPVQLPLGVICPVAFIPLLCPGPFSSDILSFKMLQNAASQTLLGQVAGYQAAICLNRKIFPSQLSLDTLQSHLLQSGVELIYLSDIDPKTDPDFVPFQRLALLACFPQNQVRPNDKWVSMDLEYLAERTGFSFAELEVMTKNTTRRSGLLVLFRNWEMARLGKNE